MLDVADVAAVFAVGRADVVVAVAASCILVEVTVLVQVLLQR